MVNALLIIILVRWASLSEALLDNQQKGRCEGTNRLVQLGDHNSHVIDEKSGSYENHCRMTSYSFVPRNMKGRLN